VRGRFFLKSVAIEHFKALRRTGRVNFTPLTVFIGNNGSGKSSLIEALETYRQIVLDGLDAAMNRWHGLEYIQNQRANFRRTVAPDGNGVHDDRLGFRLKGLWHVGTFDVRLEAGLDLSGNEIRIEDEILAFPAQEGRRHLRNESGTCEIHRDAGGLLPGGISGIANFLPGESAAPPDWREAVRRWQFLSLNPDPMGEPTPRRRTGGPPMLNRDGSNLGQYLWSLREASVDAFNDLLVALRFVVPYASNLQPTIAQEIERLVYLQMTEEDYKVPGWLLSTGTLRILAILACLRHPDPPPLLVIEEVENGLDPRTIHLLVEEFRAAIHAKKTQIIVTTHSPYLLDLLDLSHIVVVERVDGEPVFTRPDKEQLREWSKSFAPGRLYTMGALTNES
jgi:predicted ATPase